MIHPFKDGNGRIGRLLIPMFLYFKKMLPFPIFYISRYFSENDISYKTKLGNITKSNDREKQLEGWKEWILFFLEGVEIESRRHIETAQAIMNLYKEMISIVSKTEYVSIIDCLFRKLRVEPKNLTEEFKLSDTTTRRELKKLEEKGYIKRCGSNRKTFYIFSKLIDIIGE